MKELPIRKFTTVYEFLADDTIITKDGQPIGVYTPIDLWNRTAGALNKMVKEASMEEPIKKAIEADEVKSTPRGQLRKGLGEIPGDPTATAPEKHYPMGTFGGPKAAPKPGKGK
jgi:hypothetical protein